jgi:integrative and conjugative element protein (TIGR02256 family)
MSRVALTARVYADASASIAAAAAAAEPFETGGILLGWWAEGAVVARYAVEVPDPGATTSGWTRNEDQSQVALATALELHQHPWLGYVGDWHTHPAPSGPSGQDERAIRRASRSYSTPLLLLVRCSDGQLDARGARAGRKVSVSLTEPTE